MLAHTDSGEQRGKTMHAPRALTALALALALVLVGCPEAERRGLYFVETFGATPDDGLDDTAGIQAAISRAALAGGGIVALARGRYQIAGSIELGFAHGVMLQGAGVDVTVLERTG